MALASTATGTNAQAREWAPAGDVGVFLSTHIGPGWHLQWGLGIEGRGLFMQRDNLCDETPMLIFSGAVARAEIVGWKQVRLTLGPAIGVTNGLFGAGADATAGLDVPFGPDPSRPVGALGLDGTALMVPNLRAGYVLGAQPPAVFLGVGARLPPLVIHKSCVVGRPVRRDGARAPVAGGQVFAPIARARASGGAETVQRAGRAWVRRARTEWASVPAFCELAEQLGACGAPAPLQARARAAAADELRHAVDSACVARALSGAACLDLDPPVTAARGGPGA